MTLIVALTHHRGALRAALRAEYGIDLRAVQEGRTMPVDDLADLVQWLPAGSALWASMGGPASLSVEARELREVAYWLRVLDYRERGSKGEKPTRLPEPKWAHERRAEESAMERKAAHYRRRQSVG